MKSTQTARAFGLSSPRDRERHWAKIPDDTDIVVTHGPPHGILDRIQGQTEHQGDPELLAEVKRVQPLLHVFGHVHGAMGLSSRTAPPTSMLPCSV
ncbi:metallophosphoesterase [Terriglobus sp.]|uniref:metallophosphoesterase n=1 Tax=Terriglobus sp. TaxID=1889013 RepID=UPI003B0063F6